MCISMSLARSDGAVASVALCIPGTTVPLATTQRRVRDIGSPRAAVLAGLMDGILGHPRMSVILPFPSRLSAHAALWLFNGGAGRAQEWCTWSSQESRSHASQRAFWRGRLIPPSSSTADGA